MKRLLFSGSLSTLLLITGLAKGQSLQSCRAVLSHDTLVLENDRIARRFSWNNGHLITLSLTDKKQQRTWNWISIDPDCSFPGHAKAGDNGQLETKQVVGQLNQTDHLEVSVTTRLGTLSVRRVFRIYPGLAALNCTFYLQGKASAEWQQAAKKAAGGMDFKNIESQDDLNKFFATAPAMDKLALAGNHWRGRAVEFVDMTDRNNTLVNEVAYNLYRQPGYLTGNLLWLNDGLSGSSFFILKESPVSAVQLANPGFDFLVKNGSVQPVGVGIIPADLSETAWVRGYGYTLGLGGASELEGLQTLRSYQDAKRPRRPARDDMILMNTWGDRNKDTKIREQFIINELQKAAGLGVSRFQIDDGWQLGKSMNSATPGGSSEAIWNNPAYWTPDPERFPNGLKPVIEAARKLNIELGLWFSPSIDSSFRHWDKDAQTLIGLYKQYGIRTFKIDLVQIPDKTAEVNFRKFLDTVQAATSNNVVFNMDVTAGRRNGYHFMNEYGNLFLENRYTDWTNYYPYWTLRNLWNLSRYVPAQNLQIEFLNKWRNADKYPAGDRFAPANYPFDYLFAITMMAQPLAWFEATGLPAEAFQTAQLIKTYRALQPQIHGGQIFPIGDEPSGKSWTGFQSIRSEKDGFLLVFREDNAEPQQAIRTWLPAGKRVRLQPVSGRGKALELAVSADGRLPVTLPTANSFGFYRYTIL
ncbi:alpha-galactosidase [uncultured Fibrella sp.]|uniref:alpha-galactosidase n=1 Tax=uncultured Fibrella sp. TaxID=1284596 RepID=UPI0035C98BE9